MTRWMTVAGVGLCSLLLLSGPGAWAVTPAQEVEEDCSLQSDLVTPHKEWAKPSAGGPVRALFFVYTGAYDGSWEDMGTRVREVVELAQRFDIQADAVLFCGSGDKWVFHGQALGQERAERLLEKPYQLYVVAGFPLEKLPAKAQYLMLKQVAAGAGLVCCGPGAQEFMTAKRRLNPTPPELVAGLPSLDGKSPAQAFSAYRLKDGRGVWLNYDAAALAPSPEFTPRGLNTYDYRMLWVGRAALWAASREGQVAVSSVLGDQSLTVKQEAAGTAGEIILTAKNRQPLEVTVSEEIRRAADGVRALLAPVSVVIQPGQPARCGLGIPRLRDGDYFLDVIVKSKRGVEACGAGTFTVQSDFGVDQVKLERSFVESGETIKGTVTLRGAAPAGSALRMGFRDSYGRLLGRQDRPVVAGQADYPVEYTADAFSTMEMHVEALLISGGREVELKDALFTVPKRRQGDFQFVMWDAAMNDLGYYSCRQVQQAGYNVCLRGSFGESPQPAVLRACDVSLVPYSTRIMDDKDEHGFMKPMCWNDEPAVTQYVQEIVDHQKHLREQGVFVYSLGDEGVTLGCCVHPACLAAYRRYLAAQYGTIEQLNASWGTAYKSFDEVDLLDHKDNMENAAVRTCFPRWCDRQMFARYNLMQFSGRFARAYRALDPLSKTGFEGTGGFGDDYDQILGLNGFYGPYPSIGDDIIRSAAPPGLVNSNWMGYSKTGDALCDAAWRMVMKGKNSIWYWMWSGIGSWRGYLRPTLDFWPAINDLTEEMRPVRQGLGDLIMRSKLAHSGIAVVYSVPSALSSQVENSNQFTGAQPDHETWSQLTYDLGLDFRYVTSGMLTRGALDSGEFKTVVLLMQQALSPEEAAAIRRFAERGGTVIADVRPAIFDAHCKPVSPGPLDELFGIKRTGRGKALVAPLALKATVQGQAVDLQLPAAKLDLDVEATSGHALASAQKAPALIVNGVGTGRAILLNFQFSVGKAADPPTVAARRLLRFLYDVAGARGGVSVAAPDGQPLPMTETRAWRTGDALVFGVWRQMENAWFSPTASTVAGAPVPASLTFPAPRHVYDLRARRYLGRVSRVDAALRWGRASFYLALPYPIKGLRAGLTPASPRAGEPLTVDIALDVPGPAREQFAAWVEVTDPSGAHPLWGQRVVMLPRGRGRVQFPCAYNDLPGTWRVRATELFSRQTAEATWQR